MNKTWVRFGRCRRWRSGVNVLTFQRECAEHTEAGGGVGGGSEIKDLLLWEQRNAGLRCSLAALRTLESKKR